MENNKLLITQIKKESRNEIASLVWSNIGNKSVVRMIVLGKVILTKSYKFGKYRNKSEAEVLAKAKYDYLNSFIKIK